MHTHTRILLYDVVGISVLALLTYSVLFAPHALFLLDAVNLVFHEAGHAILFWAPRMLMVLGGSVLQLAIPFICALVFIRQGAFNSSMLAWWWVGHNLLSVSTYVSDARIQALPLLGGDAASHDWAYLLDAWGLLSYDTRIGAVLYYLGFAIMLFVIVHSIEHVWNIRRNRFQV
jgi:hypothetical protein